MVMSPDSRGTAGEEAKDKEISRATDPLFQAHDVLETSCRFRLMMYWNQMTIPGSFVDWKMLAVEFEVSTVFRNVPFFRLLEVSPMPDSRHPHSLL